MIEHVVADSDTRTLDSGNQNGSIDTEAENDTTESEEMPSVTPPLVHNDSQSNGEFMII